MALKNIDAVIFDLDNTLYSEEEFYFQYFKIFCKKFNYSFKVFLVKFDIKKQIFKTDILRNALLKIKKFNCINHDKSYKLLISFKCKLKLFKGVLETLNFLKKDNKIKIGILTNGSAIIQKRKITNLKIKKKVDEIVYASNFKKQKPFKYSYIEILKLLKANPKKTIFIGDNYKTDMIGAKKLGMFTIHYSKQNRVKKNIDVDKVAKNFQEVKMILKYL